MAARTGRVLVCATWRADGTRVYRAQAQTLDGATVTTRHGDLTAPNEAAALNSLRAGLRDIERDHPGAEQITVLATRLETGEERYRYLVLAAGRAVQAEGVLAHAQALASLRAALNGVATQPGHAAPKGP